MESVFLKLLCNGKSKSDLEWINEVVQEKEATPKSCIFGNASTRKKEDTNKEDVNPDESLTQIIMTGEVCEAVQFGTKQCRYCAAIANGNERGWKKGHNPT